MSKGFSEAEILERNKEVIELLDGFNTFSCEKKKDVELQMVNLLNGFIIRECNRYRGYNKDFEDLKQEAIVAVLQALPDYNPRKCMPTTFFGVYINGVLSKCCIPEGVTNYYHAQLFEIKKALMAEGIDPDDIFNIPDDAIAAITKKSIKTIKEVKQQMFSKVSLTSVGEDVPSTSFNTSPEALILQEERYQLLRRAFNELSELEQVLLEYMYLIDKPYSERKMVNLINDNLSRFNLPKKIDAKFVNQKKNVAAMKVRNFPGMDKVFIFDKENYQGYIPIEETEVEDVQNAIICGILDL